MIPLLSLLPKHPLNGKKYSIALIDCPWAYYGDPNKNAAAGKHYSLMTDEEIKALPVKSILNKDAYVFVWATCPKLDLAIEAIKAWGLCYRGIGHIWVKANKAGKIINGQGIPPTYSKPTTELLLVATTKKTGRPVKLLNSAIQQVVVEPRPKGHSTKPTIFYDLIEKALGPSHNRIEIFARSAYTGWDAIGNAVSGGEDINTTLKRMTYDHTTTISSQSFPTPADHPETKDNLGENLVVTGAGSDTGSGGGTDGSDNSG